MAHPLEAINVCNEMISTLLHDSEWMTYWLRATVFQFYILRLIEKN